MKGHIKAKLFETDEACSSETGCKSKALKKFAVIGIYFTWLLKQNLDKYGKDLYPK